MDAQSIQIIGFMQKTPPLLKLYYFPCLIIDWLALVRAWFSCLIEFQHLVHCQICS